MPPLSPADDFQSEALAALRVALATFTVVARQTESPALACRAASAIVKTLKDLPALHHNIAQFAAPVAQCRPSAAAAPATAPAPAPAAITPPPATLARPAHAASPVPLAPAPVLSQHRTVPLSPAPPLHRRRGPSSLPAHLLAPPGMATLAGPSPSVQRPQTPNLSPQPPPTGTAALRSGALRARYHHPSAAPLRLTPRPAR